MDAEGEQDLHVQSMGRTSDPGAAALDLLETDELDPPPAAQTHSRPI